jgi:bifunctional non-homologous end joining protein LigD
VKRARGDEQNVVGAHHAVAGVYRSALDNRQNVALHALAANVGAAAALAAGDDPGRYTATLKKSARDKRIFIDYLRNSREATAVAAYSTRARPGATVSTPLSWTELGSQKTPNFFTVLNLPQRLSRLRKDPWHGIEGLKQRLPQTTGARAVRSK